MRRANDMKQSYLRALAPIATVTAILAFAGIKSGHAEELIDSAKATAFDNRVFAGPLGAKTYACFVHRYDAGHLAQHPKQKVSAMKLLVTAEKPPEEQVTNYAFRVGITYRRRAGMLDSQGCCRHIVAKDEGSEIRFGCGVDCDGGGIGIAMKDDKSALVRLQRIRLWKHNKPDDEPRDELTAGADDGIFQLDRVDASECAALVTDRKEVAALGGK
jgi:hypothetical protein